MKCFMMFADQMEIERKGQDKFCAGAKAKYCKEVSTNMVD